MQVHPQISQFITLVLILSPHFKPSHPWNNYPLRQSLFTLNISDPSMNPSHSVHNLNNNFFFGTANNAVMNQIGTTTTTNWNRNTSNNKKHWQNRLDWNIKETATMTRSWHDRVNSFTTRLSHRRYTHRSHTDHRRSLSLSQPNLRRHHLCRRRHWWKRKERWEIEIPETYLLF